LIPFADDEFDVLTATEVTDRYNNKTKSWDNPTRVAVSGVHVQPLGTQEDEALGSGSTTETYQAFYGAESVLTASNRVEWESDTYEVVGEPERWPDPFGGLAYKRAVLRRIRGTNG
jgi:hypothetical protein